MGKKSAPPPAPDYTKAAESTASSNLEAQRRADWANRPDQIDMYGNKTTWTSNMQGGQGGAGAKLAGNGGTGGMEKWTQTVTLAPEQQAALDQQMAIQKGLMTTGQSMLGRADAAVSQPFDWGRMQAYGQAPQAGGLQAGYLGAGPQIGATYTDPGKQIQAGNLKAQNLSAGPNTQAQNLSAGPNLQAQNLSAGPNLQAQNLNPNAYMTSGAGQGIQGSLNTGAMGALPKADAAERQRIENMLFDRQNPARQQQSAQLETKLSNMGLTRGSEAWNREMQRMGDQQSRERYDAMQTGGQEMERLFGMGMQNRQQSWDEMQGAGNFANQAQAQRFGQTAAQNQQNFGMQAQAGQQNFGQQAQALQDNWSRQAQTGAQNFGQQAQALQDNWSRQAQTGAQNFGQQAQANQDNFSRQAQAGAQNFGQQAQAGQQNFAQQSQSAQDWYNRMAGANAQNFGQQSQSVQDYFGRLQGAGNQNFAQQQAAQAQNFNQGMTQANYQNQLRQQQIAEQQLARQMPLNELNAFISGQQVQAPTYGNFLGSQSAGGVDYSGAAGQQYNAAMDSYNAKQAQAQGAMSGITSIAGAGLMAF